MTREDFRKRLAERIHHECAEGIPRNDGTRGPVIDDIDAAKIANLFFSELGKTNLALCENGASKNADRT
ncbi:hypothetical protein [Aurantimonas manganoxydans]|uniref:hypothetical protein n=1 Tax=Aurantimonas manganoxydans TaxID=651183 RepID=UPI000A5CD3E4|nr:hypothetical protein [Aurantimonas manganoxydans]